MSANPYSSREWRIFRREYLGTHTRCVCSVSAGKHHHANPCGKPANTVDHVIPARAGGVRAFQAMCASCHSFKTATYDGGFGHAS